VHAVGAGGDRLERDDAAGRDVYAVREADTELAAGELDDRASRTGAQHRGDERAPGPERQHDGAAAEHERVLLARVHASGIGASGLRLEQRPTHVVLLLAVPRRPTPRPTGASAPLAASATVLLLGGLLAFAVSSASAAPLLAVSAAAALASVAIGRRRAVVLRQAAFTDRLTGLYRYEYFADALPREIERVRRYGTELSLVVFDLDRFKDFNDRHGHSAGNHLLAGVGRALQRETRGTDLAARFGGEELIVLVQGGAHDASALAERVRRSVAELAVPVPDGLAGTTISAGVATFPREPDAASLLDAADGALYEAKRSGRNRVIAATDTAATRVA
jgi:diguanylate cyclase (GGDEF)-like protein